jgi:hypothetical protein
MKKLFYASMLVLAVSLPGCLTTTPSSGTIGVNPDSITVAANTSQAFSVILTGAFANISVKWSIQGQGCSSGSCGTIDQSGNYTAPKTAPANPLIQIIAADTADPSKFGVANVTIGAAVSISITQPVANPSTVASTQTLTFAGKVINSSNTAINWSVAGPGCSGTACGTFSPTQTPNASTTTTYTAPNPLPGPPTVTVTATSAADPNQTATLTINLTLLVGLNPGSATVTLLDSQPFQANISGLQNTPAATVNWTLTQNGASCSPGCGTITPNIANPAQASYQAPAALPSPAALTVTASVSQGVANGPLTGTGTGTVTVTNSASGANGQLFDHYAFIYRGYTLNAGAVTPFVEAGSLIFDGTGNIVAGSVEDDNNGSSFHQQRAVTGTYQFDAADNTRGSITLSAGLVTSLRFILVPNGAAVATTVFLTDFGGAAAGSGSMQQQDKTQFSNTALSNDHFALSVRGGANGGTAVAAAIGRFDIDAAGANISTGELGRTFNSGAAFGDCGTTSATITFPAFSNFFTGTISSVTSSGNATFSLSNVSIKGAAGISATFSTYIVSASKLFLVETDNTGFSFVGTAEKQSSTSFTNADFSGVYSQSLRSLNGSSTGNGAGNVDHTAFHSPGTNAAGTIIINFGEWGGNLDGNPADILEGLDFEGNTAAAPGGYYSVQSNGLALVAACPGGFMPRYVMYLISPSRAYVWNIDSSTADLSVTHVGDSIGEIDLQQPQPPTQMTSMGAVTFAVSFEGIEGNFLGNVHTASNAISASGVVKFDTPAAGQVTFILDISRGAQNTGSTPVTAIGSYDFSCNNLDVDVDGCNIVGPAEDFPWNYAAITGITFSGSPPFKPPIPNHFWFVSANQLLFDYIDTTTQTATSNIGGVAVKNQ